MGDIGPERAHYEVLPLHSDSLVPVELPVAPEVETEPTVALDPTPVEPEPAH